MTMTEIKQILKNHDGLNFNPIRKSNKTDILFRTLENRGINDVAKFSDPVYPTWILNRHSRLNSR